MLIQKRHELILEELNKKSEVYIGDLVKLLDTSESTIRRDLIILDQNGLLKKVHGGAVKITSDLMGKEDEVVVRQNINREEKQKIAKYAASLIEPYDFVFIDAGTTTELMIDYIIEKNACYVTNAIAHAKKLINNQFKTFILGGEVKWATEAIVGAEAIKSISKYNFTKGFFGSNGISLKNGYTTPDIKEALVKEEALNRTKKAYVLCDKSKFNCVSSVTFGNINKASIITTKLCDNEYISATNILEVLE